MLQKLLSAAVVIGTLRVNSACWIIFLAFLSSTDFFKTTFLNSFPIKNNILLHDVISLPDATSCDTLIVFLFLCVFILMFLPHGPTSWFVIAAFPGHTHYTPRKLCL